MYIFKTIFVQYLGTQYTRYIIFKRCVNFLCTVIIIFRPKTAHVSDEIFTCFWNDVHMIVTCWVRWRSHDCHMSEGAGSVLIGRSMFSVLRMTSESSLSISSPLLWIRGWCPPMSKWHRSIGARHSSMQTLLLSVMTGSTILTSLVFSLMSTSPRSPVLLSGRLSVTESMADAFTLGAMEAAHSITAPLTGRLLKVSCIFNFSSGFSFLRRRASSHSFPLLASNCFCRMVSMCFGPPILCSAASALEIPSVFFHFVLRFWNHIFTWGQHEEKQKEGHKEWKIWINCRGKREARKIRAVHYLVNTRTRQVKMQIVISVPCWHVRAHGRFNKPSLSARFGRRFVPRTMESGF